MLVIFCFEVALADKCNLKFPFKLENLIIPFPMMPTFDWINEALANSFHPNWMTVQNEELEAARGTHHKLPRNQISSSTGQSSHHWDGFSYLTALDRNKG